MQSEKKNQSGRLISAGEVGAYVVCPESWRLRYVAQVPRTQQEESFRGTVLHDAWFERIATSNNLREGIRFVLLLFALGFLLLTQR